MSAPWAPERVAAEVERRFPGTTAWLGRHTGSWWAVARDRAGRYRLVEGATPADLVRRLDELGVRRAGSVREPRAPRRPPARPPGRPVPPRRRPARVRRGWLRSALGGLVTS